LITLDDLRRSDSWKPEFDRVASWWEKIVAVRGALPCRADFEPTDFPRDLPRIALIEIQTDPFDCRYRVAGTEIAFTAGRDPTGKSFSELYEGDHLEQALATYRAIVEERQPLCGSRVVKRPTPNEFMSYSRLILPLAKDGCAVDMVLLVVADLTIADADGNALLRPRGL
jgi:hypothetical protein